MDHIALLCFAVGKWEALLISKVSWATRLQCCNTTCLAMPVRYGSGPGLCHCPLHHKGHPSHCPWCQVVPVDMRLITWISSRWSSTWLGVMLGGLKGLLIRYVQPFLCGGSSVLSCRMPSFVDWVLHGAMLLALSQFPGPSFCTCKFSGLAGGHCLLKGETT